MPVYDHPISLVLPIQVGNLKTTFYINQNLYTVNEECDTIPHNHPHYELLYFEAGNANQMINYRSYPVNEGNLIVIHPSEYHFQLENQNIRRFSIRFSIENNSTKSPSAKLAGKDFSDYLDKVYCLSIDNKNIAYLFEQLRDELYTLNTGYVFKIKYLCSSMLVELIRLLEHDFKDIYPPDELKYHGHIETQIDAFFEKKYLSDVNVNDLANDMNVSVRQVNNIMNKMFGMPFSQTLKRMRIELAATQLLYTDTPISKICHDCGFASQNCFISQFKKYYNMSPSQFRKNSKSNTST